MDTQDRLIYKGQLVGHNGWVTSIATPLDNSDKILTGSRDKSLILWKLQPSPDSTTFGVPKKRFTGHSHYVQDVVLSSDGQFALSGSWDATLRLWDINQGKTSRTFVKQGHEKDVLTVAFSPDNRQIVSAGRDRCIKLWNTLGECKYTITEDGHTDWVTCVRFSPITTRPIIVSGGYDRVVKVWNLANCKIMANLLGHRSYISTLTVSPDGSLCASGGKDGTAMLWDLNKGEHLYSLEAGDTINSLCFSPNRYWLCAATQQSIKIWDLESKNIIVELVPDFKENVKNKPSCISLAWSTDGSNLFAGYTDNVIRVFGLQ